jgi:4-hydroxy-3-methylbut-2-enyl diphosphate reductase
MEMERCRHCGLCGGVRKALTLAERLIAGGWRVHCCGELAHSASVQKFLLEKGATGWSGEGRDWGRRDCLLIPTHGVSFYRREQLRATGCALFDGTCPVVRRSGERIRQLAGEGLRVLLFGRREHPEVIGLSEGTGVVVCESEADLPPADGKPTALIAQTTADGEELARFSAAARKRFLQLRTVPSLCEEVLRRRRELAEALAGGRYGHVLVVSGRRSANGQALAAIARRSGVAVTVAESPEELPKISPAGSRRLLIASATSTPDWAIEKMERFLRGGASRRFPAGNLGSL